MVYKVLITPEAEEDIDRFIAYLINEKNSNRLFTRISKERYSSFRCCCLQYISRRSFGCR